MLSIGLGGHISLKDVRITNGVLDVMKTIKAGASREVREELEIHKVVASKELVLLHSRLNAVNEVHCGFVEVWKIESPQVTTKEKSLKTIGFKTLSELANMQGFETWSTLLIQHLNHMSQSIQ
jgi:predicted NUDIX family phosphoesterase